MKHIICTVLAVWLCLGCLLLPAAAQETTPPAAEPTTEVIAETTAAAQDPAAETTQAAAESEPTTAPITLIDPANLDIDAYDQWYSSPEGRYYRWKNGREDRSRFDRAFRQFYASDPDITIVDHVVYCKYWGGAYGFKRNPYYLVIDFFDTDAAEQSATKLRVRSEIDGIPVRYIYVYGETEWSAGIFDSGYSNDTVKSVVLDEGFSGVSAFAFMNFSALKTVTIPDSATFIDVSAFKNCKKLKTIIGAKNVTSVRSSAFQNCESLSAFPHMETLKNIEGSAFANCAFKTLTLAGSGWYSGGDEDHYSAWGAFADCKKLKKVTFLDGSKKKGLNIGMKTFYGCTALKVVTLPKKCAEIFIEDSAFYGCTSLKTLNNMEKVTEIWRFTFGNCTALQSVTLPAGIKTVALDAFKGCKNLKTLNLKSTDTDLLSGTFFNGWNYPGDTGDGVTTNFVKHLPKKCTVYVVNKAMKLAVKTHGCRGTVKIKVDVAAPKTLKATTNGKTATLKWTKVKNADGYRVYLYNAKTNTYTTLKTVKANVTQLKLTSGGKQFAVRAYRIIDGDVSWSGYSKIAG